MLNKPLFLCFISIASSFTIYTKSLANTFSKPELSPIVQIVTLQADSIDFLDAGKIYLKADKIYPTNHGPLLFNNSSGIFLQNLSSDQMGYYLLLRDRDDFRLYCKKCKISWWFS